MHLLTPFEVAVFPHRSQVRVAPAGELDIGTSCHLRARLDELWELGCTEVVVDLRSVTFMDSSALHVLIDGHEHAARTGARFSIIDGPEPVSRLIDLCRLRETFTFDAA